MAGAGSDPNFRAKLYRSALTQMPDVRARVGRFGVAIIAGSFAISSIAAATFGSIWWVAQGSQTVILLIMAVLWSPFLITCLLHEVILQRFMTDRVLNEQMRRQRCFWCSYSLEGLPSEEGWRSCPECGKQNPTSVSAIDHRTAQ